MVGIVAVVAIGSALAASFWGWREAQQLDTVNQSLSAANGRLEQLHAALDAAGQQARQNPPQQEGPFDASTPTDEQVVDRGSLAQGDAPEYVSQQLAQGTEQPDDPLASDPLASDLQPDSSWESAPQPAALSEETLSASVDLVKRRKDRQ